MTTARAHWQDNRHQYGGYQKRVHATPKVLRRHIEPKVFRLSRARGLVMAILILSGTLITVAGIHHMESLNTITAIVAALAVLFWRQILGATIGAAIGLAIVAFRWLVRFLWRQTKEAALSVKPKNRERDNQNV